jgi:hypothetical protein
MKNTFVMMALLGALFCVCLGGCGGGKSQPVESAPARPQSGSAEQAPQTGSLSIKYSDNTRKSVPLPARYPKDRFPVYADSFIAAVQDDGTSFVMTCFSRDARDKVTAYYKEVLKGAQVISVTDDDKGYVSFGVKDGYTYTVAIGASSEFEGYPTTIAISLLPAEKGMAETLKQMPLPASKTP